MKIVSIDPGTQYLGWAIFDGNILLSSGCEVYRGKYDGKKLNRIITFIDNIVNDADVIVCESYFVQGSAKGAGVIPELRGAIRYIASKYGKELEEMHPGSVKLGVTGKGNSSKELVHEMIKIIYNIEPRRLDESDAVAIGHAWLCKSDGGIGYDTNK